MDEIIAKIKKDLRYKMVTPEVDFNGQNYILIERPKARSMEIYKNQDNFKLIAYSGLFGRFEDTTTSLDLSELTSKIKELFTWR